MQTHSKSSRATLILALSTVWVVWGSTYTAIRIADRTLPPLAMCAVRFLIAGTLLFAWCYLHDRLRQRWVRPTSSQWRASAILGLALPAAGTGGASWAEQRLPSGTVALILATIPVWITVASAIADRTLPSLRTMAGLATGLIGVGVLVGPISARPADLLSALVALGGAVAWGVGSAYGRNAPQPDNKLLGSALEMLCAGAALAVVSMVVGEYGSIHAGTLTTAPALAALGYLIVFGSIVAYTAFGYVLRHAPGPLVASCAFVNPIVALILGVLLLGETVTPRTGLAAAIIVAGVVLLVVPSRNSGKPRQRPQTAAPVNG